MNEKIRRIWPNALVLFLFSACTLVQFWPALTGAVSLSKVQQLAEWDSLFVAQKSGQSMLMDPSVAYYMVPHYLFKAALIRAGQLPLWNPYSGLGCPLAADPESLAFSPLHLPLIFAPGFTAYHQVLVLEIIILGLSTFALARSLKLGLTASVFAMVALAFCPYERWYLELLGNGLCFVPLVFWLILDLRSKLSAGKIWIAGFGCAMMVLTAHPELSFCSIGMASLALVLFVLFDRADIVDRADAVPIDKTEMPPPPSAYKQRIVRVCLGLLIAGIFAFMISAPMLVPFIEYLRNCDTYKFGNGAPAIVRWQTLVFNLLQPGFGGASPTLGPCALLLIPLAFCTATSNKTLVRVLAGLTVFCLALTGKVFPLNLLLAHPPFSYLVVNYAFPSAILMTAILAAVGLNTALSAATPTNKEGRSSIKIGKWALALSLAAALLVALFPLVTKALQIPLNSANFDMCLPDYTFNRNDVLRYSLFALLAGIALLAIKIKPVRKSALFLTATICLGQTAEIITAAKSMPQRPSFKYQETAIVPQLKLLTENGNLRFIATGSHLFKPDSNIVFGLSDLRDDNALFPRGYLTYMLACGARLDKFCQEFDGPLSPLLGLSSVHSVLSQEPVTSKAALAAQYRLQKNDADKALTIQPELGIKAIFSQPILDKQKRAVFAYLTLEAPALRAAALTYNLVLYDHSGQLLWFSDARTLLPDLNQSNFVAIPMPVAEPGKTFVLGLQFFDKVTGKWLMPNSATALSSKIKDAFFLGAIDWDGHSVEPATADYKLSFESSSRMRIYQNTQALPRAYAVHHSLTVATAEAALLAIQEPSFNPRQTVVLDSTSTDGENGAKAIHLDVDAPEGVSNTANQKMPTPREDTVKIVSIEANQVLIDATLGRPGIVVLNDIFYPGWQCHLDRRPVPIIRANYLMRAVEVPSGRHSLAFTYRPLSFTAGVCLWILALIMGMGIALHRVIQNRRNKRPAATA